MKSIAAFCLLFTCLAAPCFAQVDLPDVAPPPAAPHADRAPTYTHPTLPESDIWPGALLVVVIGMFLAAAVVGPIVRLEMPEEMPPMHSHDEPPGTSHHHGSSGTVQPGPEHELPGGHAHH